MTAPLSAHDHQRFIMSESPNFTLNKSGGVKSPKSFGSTMMMKIHDDIIKEEEIPSIKDI
jgi:hypothetical protein